MYLQNESGRILRKRGTNLYVLHTENTRNTRKVKYLSKFRIKIKIFFLEFNQEPRRDLNKPLEAKKSHKCTFKLINIIIVIVIMLSSSRCQDQHHHHVDTIVIIITIAVNIIIEIIENKSKSLLP
jgi:hypothetical protein